MPAKPPSGISNERAGAAAPPAPVGAAVGAPVDASTDDAETVAHKVRRAVHDLRQPVQAMRLFVHLLETRLDGAEDRALVAKLDEALENIDSALRALMNSVPPAERDAGGSDDPPPVRR
jgi:two-component system, sensor histidine kinase